MKKKILFMLINMNIGGTEKAMLNLLSEIPPEKYEISILMLEEYGGFLDFLPSHVHIEYLQNYSGIKSILNQPPHLTALHFFKMGKLAKAFAIISLHIISKVMKERSTFYQYLLKDYPIDGTEYDAAVAYAGPMDFISFFVINKIKAKKKIQWIHFDVSQIGFNQKFVSKIYNKFDKIFVVSVEGKNKLINILPHLQKKVDTFSNLISPNSIVELAKHEEGFKDQFTGTRILTVGRLTKEKGQDLVIPVLAKLKRAGYNVRWYCIGDGRDRGKYEKLVQENDVNNDFIFLGAVSNPYPFMEQCDIYVQPSRHEGYCITLAEAKCFKKSIISTNFTGASEQIIHDHSGIIVNFDEQEMYQAIKRLLDDENLKRKLADNLLNDITKNSTTTEMEKLFKIVNH